MTRQDHVTQFIEALTRLKCSLLKFEDTSYQTAVFYLDMAIKSLENYKANQGQFESEPPPKISNIQKTTTQNKENLWQQPLSQQNNECETGKHWVRKPLKNGEPGFCRSNPQRLKS